MYCCKIQVEQIIKGYGLYRLNYFQIKTIVMKNCSFNN